MLVVDGESSPILTEESPVLKMARKAAIKDDKGVQDSEDRKKVKSDMTKTNLHRLQNALKDAAVAVAQRAAVVASTESMQGGLSKLKSIVREREQFEHSQTAAKALADAARIEVVKDRMVDLAAYKAQTSAAIARDTQNRATARGLREKISEKKLAAQEAANRAVLSARRAARRHMRQVARAREKKTKARAVAAEHKEAEARAAKVNAESELKNAALAKGVAMRLKKSRGLIPLSAAQKAAMAKAAMAKAAMTLVAEDEW